jgi:hypothetical protein
MIMKSFQIQLDAVQKEIKRTRCGHMEKERVAVPKVTKSYPTTTVKELIKKMEDPWKTVSAKKTDKRTNKSASTVKEVLPQIPQKHQNTVANAQTSYLQKLKRDIKSSVNPQKVKDSLGWAHYHLDSKNIVERERSELSQAINGSCDRGQNGEGITKHISDININSLNSLQRGGLTLLSETIELQNDTISGNQERQLSSERYCSFSSPIPERILQGSSSCCISELTRYHHSTNTVQGSNVGEAKILQYPYPEPLELHNKEGHSGFSTISGRDGNTVNKIEVVHKVHQL